MKLAGVLMASVSLLRAGECPPAGVGEKEILARFQELDRAAQNSMERSQFAAAAAQYREAACLVPKSARAFYGLGIAEAAAGQYPAARDALESAYAILPDNVMPLTMLVRVAAAMNDIDGVKTVLLRVARRFPHEAELHCGLGRFLAEHQLLDLALAESLRCQEGGRGDAASVVALAVLENSVGAYEDAIRHATAVEKQSGVPDAVKAAAAGVAGLSYESIGEREQAEKHLQRAVELAPQAEDSYLALAFLYEKQRRFPDAVELLEQGRKRMRPSPQLLLALGNHLVWAERYPAGIAVLSEVIRQVPATPDAYLRLAEAYRNTGEPGKEVETLQTLARIQPEYPMVWVMIARALLGMETVDHQAVERALAQAEKSAPNDPEIFYLRGRTYEAMGRQKEAAAAFQRAIELRPMDPAPYYRLGMVYRKLGQADLAREVLARMAHIKAEAPGP